MAYVVIGIIGLVVVVTGVTLGALGYDMGGFIVGASGSILTAVGLIGFGLTRRREKRPSVPTGRSSEASAKDLAEILDSITRLLVERGYGGSPEVASEPAATPGRRRIGRAEFEAAIKAALSPNLVEGLMRVQRERGELGPEETSRYFIQQRELVADNAAGLKRLSELGADAETLAEVASAGPDQEALAKAIAKLLKQLEPPRAGLDSPGEAEETNGWIATYEFRRDPKYGPGATLRISSAGETYGHFRCRVTNPSGEVAEAAPRTGGILIPAIARNNAAVHYPGQFRLSIPRMPPGRYVVEWFGLTDFRPDAARKLLARISFEFAEGYTFP